MDTFYCFSAITKTFFPKRLQMFSPSPFFRRSFSLESYSQEEHCKAGGEGRKEEDALLPLHKRGEGKTHIFPPPFPFFSRESLFSLSGRRTKTRDQSNSSSSFSPEEESNLPPLFSLFFLGRGLSTTLLPPTYERTHRRRTGEKAKNGNRHSLFFYENRCFAESMKLHATWDQTQSQCFPVPLD